MYRAWSLYIMVTGGARFRVPLRTLPCLPMSVSSLACKDEIPKCCCSYNGEQCILHMSLSRAAHISAQQSCHHVLQIPMMKCWESPKCAPVLAHNRLTQFALKCMRVKVCQSLWQQTFCIPTKARRSWPGTKSHAHSQLSKNTES